MKKKTDEETTTETQPMQTEEELQPEAAPSESRETIRIRNTNLSNGKIGTIANPRAKDVDAWLAKGWVRDDE